MRCCWTALLVSLSPPWSATVDNTCIVWTSGTVHLYERRALLRHHADEDESETHARGGNGKMRSSAPSVRPSVAFVRLHPALSFFSQQPRRWIILYRLFVDHQSLWSFLISLNVNICATKQTMRCTAIVLWFYWLAYCTRHLAAIDHRLCCKAPRNTKF